jgi:hypothetical protein
LNLLDKSILHFGPETLSVAVNLFNRRMGARSNASDWRTPAVALGHERETGLCAVLCISMIDRSNTAARFLSFPFKHQLFSVRLFSMYPPFSRVSEGLFQRGFLYGLASGGYYNFKARAYIFGKVRTRKNHSITSSAPASRIWGLSSNGASGACRRPRVSQDRRRCGYLLES